MNKNRFWNEFKVVVANNWKLDLGLLGIIFFSTLAFIVLIVDSGLFGEGEASLTVCAENAMMLSGTVGLVAMSYCAAMVFGDLGNKSVQVNLMMNPASVAEKFWTRILHSFLMVTILSDAVMYAAVMLWLLFQTDEVGMLVFEHFIGLKNGSNDFLKAMVGTPLLYIMSFMYSCSFVAVYAVGATYFRKHPFLHTTLTVIGIFLVMLFAFGFALGVFMGYYGSETVMAYVPDAYTLTLGLTVFHAALCLLMLRWAYCRFAGMQYKTR